MMEPTFYTSEGTSDYDPSNYSSLEPNVCEMDAVSRITAMFTTILYSLIFLLSLLGNSLVLWVIMKYESLTSLTNLFIVNLCATDLAFSCTLPFWIVYSYYGWIFGEFLCKAVTAIFCISYYGGIIFLTIMTVLRYLAVVDPLSSLRTQTKRCGRLLSLVIWACSLLIALPEIIHTQVVLHDGMQYCDYEEESVWKQLELGLQSAFFLCSFATFAFCYIRMLKILLRQRSQRRHRTVRLIFAIVLVFFLSWAPYNVLGSVYVLSSWQYISLTCDMHKQVFFAFDISRKIAYGHCCLNPVLYVFVGMKFRRHLKLLCKHYSPCHSRIPPSSPRAHSFQMGPFEDASMY